MRVRQITSGRSRTWPFSRGYVQTCLAGVFVLLTACDTQVLEGVGDNPETSHEATQHSALTPPVQLRAVDRSALFVELELSYGESVQTFSATRQGASETWSTTLSVPTQTPFEISITWYDMADQERLDLVTSTRSFGAISEQGRSTIVIDFDDFESESFDADADSITNLQERIDGTSPFNAMSPGVNTTVSPVLLSDCGTLPIANSQPSMDLSNPLNIVPGTLHTGAVVDDTVTYYSVPLTVGQYRLVADLRNPGISEQAEIVVDQISDTGESTAILIGGYGFSKNRFLRDIDISTPQTLRLRVRHNKTSATTPIIYTLGIFDVRDPIPAPLFVECPMVIPVSSGDDASFEIAGGFENEVFLWFEAVDIQPYELRLSFSNTSVSSGFDSMVAYVDLFDAYGENISAGDHRLFTVNTGDSEFNETLVFTPRKLGMNWIRFRVFTYRGFEDDRYAVQARLTAVPREQ